MEDGIYNRGVYGAYVGRVPKHSNSSGLAVPGGLTVWGYIGVVQGYILNLPSGLNSEKEKFRVLSLGLPNSK